MLFSWSLTLETCHCQFFQLPFPQSKPVTTLSHLDLWKFTQMHLFLFTPDHWFKASSDHSWMVTMGPTVSLALLSDLCIHLAHIDSCLSASQTWLQSPSAETFRRKDLQSKALQTLQGVTLSLVSGTPCPAWPDLPHIRAFVHTLPSTWRRL